jgi:hypothetical protein
MTEGLKDFADTVNSVGLPALCVGYFLLKDWKLSKEDIKVKTAIAKALALINKTLGIEEGED